jgi:molybdenum cofactor cytidylyltransferase
VIVAIILAAGASSRMGRPKALLPCPASGYSFVRHQIEVFRSAGTDEVVVVGRPGIPQVEAEAIAAGALFTLNPTPPRGQLSSLLVGIDRAEDLGATAILSTPVDLPGISSVVVSSIIAAGRRGSHPIVRPTHEGRGGHPVYFARAMFEELRRMDPGIGARGVLRADPARVLDLAVSDPGILLDVDTPADYRRLTGG